MGNEVGKMMVELKSFEAQVEELRQHKDEKWYKMQRDIILDRNRRLAVFRDVYDHYDAVNHDALQLRRKITLICNTLREDILDGNKFPLTLTEEKVKVMGEILKNLASTYTENKEIESTTKHTMNEF